jgi:hypothetical protein
MVSQLPIALFIEGLFEQLARNIPSINNPQLILFI